MAFVRSDRMLFAMVEGDDLQHSTQLYCSLGRFCDFLSSLVSSLALPALEEDACGGEEERRDASALMGEGSDGSFLVLWGVAWV